MAAMNKITSTLSGLTSSLFLSVGLSNLAQKLDPVSSVRHEICADAQSAAYCEICNFPARR